MATWWIDKPLLLGGSNPTDDDVEALHREGFGILVSLLQEDDQLPGYDPERALTLGYKRYNIPVRDCHAPSVLQLSEFVRIVRSAPQGAKVLVHCEGGRGRTGTFAAAHWIAKGLPVPDAVARVRQVRAGAVETPEQETSLHDFAKVCAIELLADGLALAYHEARNARHILHKSAMPAAGWEKIVALPRNRVDAWKEVQSLRAAARRRSTANECARVFQERFGRTLVELRALFADPNWKHAKGYGGNAWRGVTDIVTSLQNAIAQRDQRGIQGAAQSLVAAKHNNGTLREKITGLDQEVGATAADWWKAAQVRLHFLGSGDAFGSGGRFQTCLHLSGPSAPFLIDCGASSLIAMKRAGLDPSEIGCVLLTHLHGDHFGGLPFLILDGQFTRRTLPLVIGGPPGVRERVEAAMEVFFPGSSKLDRRFAVEFIELREREPTPVGPATMTPFAVEHASGAPSYALRVEYGGKVITYSGDTEWTETLIEAARGADLFVCEAYFFEKKIKYHLDYQTLRENRHRLDCRKIVLTHMSADMLSRRDEADIGVRGRRPGHRAVIARGNPLTSITRARYSAHRRKPDQGRGCKTPAAPQL